MIVGVCKVTLHVPASGSLKAKRQVVKSVIGRIKSRFDVAVAEVGSLDRWQIAEIGIACVSNDSGHANEVLSHVVDFIERDRLDAELTDYEIELIPAL